MPRDMRRREVRQARPCDVDACRRVPGQLVDCFELLGVKTELAFFVSR